MAINFPNNPGSGEIYTEGNKSWQWLGNRWGAYNIQNPEAFAFRNKIINGNFDIWQRGTNFSITNSGTYTSDRWSIVYDGTGATRTVSRQSFSVGQTDVPNNPDYFLRWNQSVAGSGANFNVLRQPIEAVKTLAGKQVVVTFYAKAASTLDVHVFFQHYFGTGGSPSSTINIPGGTTINLNTSWQKYSVVCDITNLSGKSIGTNNNDYLVLNFNPSPINDNATFTFDIAQVQLEEGSIATPFEHRPIGTELALCQRYYQALRLFGAAVRNPPGGSSTGLGGGSQTISPTMRAVPTSPNFSTSPYFAGTYRIEGAISSIERNAIHFAAASPGYHGYHVIILYDLDAEL
jgi:hypothetical protein